MTNILVVSNFFLYHGKRFHSAYLKVVPIIRVTDSAYKCDGRKGNGVSVAFPRRGLWVFNEGDNQVEDLRGQKLETDVGLR